MVLDGDVDKNEHYKHVSSKLLLLPGSKSPEQLIADWINRISDLHPFWKSINPGYTRQYCFQTYHFSDMNNRERAKAWFQSQCTKEIWGTKAQKMMKFWKKDNTAEVETFVSAFSKMINRVIAERGMSPSDFGL